MCRPPGFRLLVACFPAGLLLSLITNYLLDRQHGEAHDLFRRAARRQRVALLDGFGQPAVLFQLQSNRRRQQQGVGQSYAEGIANSGVQLAKERIVRSGHDRGVILQVGFDRAFQVPGGNNAQPPFQALAYQRDFVLAGTQRGKTRGNRLDRQTNFTQDRAESADRDSAPTASQECRDRAGSSRCAGATEFPIGGAPLPCPYQPEL